MLHGHGCVPFNVGIHRDGRAWRYDHILTVMRDPRVIAWQKCGSNVWRITEHADTEPARIWTYITTLLAQGIPKDLPKPTTFRRIEKGVGSPARLPAHNQN